MACFSSGSMIGLPDIVHVSQCNNNPGGPIRLQNKTECGVKIPRRKPSSQTYLPTNRSQVST